jgi:hypothetical protein
MTLTIRAHFDGKVIVPDEPVALPRNTELRISVETTATTPVASTSPEEQRAAFDAFVANARAHPVPHLNDEATRRDSIYR